MPEGRMYADVLVVGSGLAGLTAAIWAAREGADVLLASSGPVCSGSSFYPGTWGLGLVGPEDKEDERDLARTILETGEGMAYPELAGFLAAGIREGLHDLEEMGIPLKEAANKAEKEFIPCFDHKNRDWHGIVKESARPAFRKELKRLKIRETPFTTVTDLFVEEGRVAGAGAVRYNKGGQKEAEKPDGRGVSGAARAENLRSGADPYGTGPDGEWEFLDIRCGAVILAGGGLGGLFSRRLNTDDVTGMCQYLALQAGAFLVNLEFMQMMPGFLTPAYKTIYNEKVFRYSRFSDPETGRSIFEGWDQAELKKQMEIRSTHGPFTCRLGSAGIDIRLFEEEVKHPEGVRLTYQKELKENQPEFVRTYFSWLKEEKGLTIDDPVQIGIFAHASNGGIRINCEGSCGVEGLYACGECTGGMHGADRLGGLSTANGLVFGKSAGIHGAAWSRKVKAGSLPASARGSGNGTAGGKNPEKETVLKVGNRESSREEGSWEGNSWGKTWVPDGEQILEKLRQINRRAAMIVRREDVLARALDEVKRLGEEAESRKKIFDTVEEFAASVPDAGLQYIRSRQLESALELSEAMLRAMGMRRESRGSHYREDYPEKDRSPAFRIRIEKKDGKLRLSPEYGGNQELQTVIE